MTTPTPLSRGRRHTLAVAALGLYHDGRSERAALDEVLAGKSVTSADREAIEVALRAAIESGEKPEAPAPDLAVVAEPEAAPDAEASDDAIIDPPGAAEREATVERIASGTEPARAKHERRSTAERLEAALADLEQAKADVMRLRYLLLADTLAKSPRARAAATVVRASVHAGFWPEAESAARRGCSEAGEPVPAWITEGSPAATRHIPRVCLDIEPWDAGDDRCFISVDGIRMAAVDPSGVVGELQIVAFDLDGSITARAMRRLVLPIGGGS